MSERLVAAGKDAFAAVVESPAVQSLLRRLEDGGALSCPGVTGSAHAFLAALVREHFPARPVVVVTGGLKAQEAFQQDVETWHVLRQRAKECSTRAPWFYPAWEILPHEAKLPHADVISERLDTLVALANHGPGSAAPLVVANVVALLQRTFTPDTLKAHTRALRRGDQLNPLDLVEWLEDCGYESEVQVNQKGEMAMRGGIIDVYPLTSPWPVRLEFFGDELDSLRTFDPVTQMSRESMDSVILPPGGELGLLRNPSSAPVSNELATLLDYLPSETIFLLSEPGALTEHAAQYAEQVPENDRFFVLWEEFQHQITARGMTLVALSEERGEGEVVAALEGGGALGLDHPSPLVPLPVEGRGKSNAPRIAGGTLQDTPRVEDASDESGSGVADSMTRPSPSPRPSPRGEGEVVAALEGGGTLGVDHPSPLVPLPVEGRGKINAPREGLSFTSLDAYRPVGERPPDPQVVEAQRREFFAQLHRWCRQGYGVHVFCNNDGERQRFGEIWSEYGFGEIPSGAAANRADEPTSPVLDLGSLTRGFLCDEARLVVVTDAEIFGRYKVQRARRLKSPHAIAARSMLDINFTDLEPGDYVVHLQHGIGRYLGLSVLTSNPGRKGEPSADSGQECLVIEYAASDSAQAPPKLYVPVTQAHLVGKYVGAGKARPALNTLGGTRWARTKEQAERAVRDLAAELLSVQAARETQSGHAFAADTTWQLEFESSFLFEETPDQMRAIRAAKADMEAPRPMDRLICGDVGFGKTEVAIRAAFKAVMGGRQVAVLVPTTVLAQQHYNTFRERMADYPVRVELLSRFRSRREQQKVIADLAAGSVDIVIGTHRLVQGDIAFKELGLVIVDEEQRFGVMQKEKFKLMRKLVDVLTLSATPIPRTLYLALTGARDMSTIETPPQDRLPVETIVTHYDERIIRDAIQRELNRGGQVFFLHNRVNTIDLMALKLRDLLPHARVVVGHGQMDADDLEEVMTRFVNGEADVLLSTTIIESGLDIPNANTIIIDRADRFGLSELYQLRGRVGRYKHQAYAYLLLPRHATLLSDARKRITAIKQYSTLGSGFKIAMRDLEIRGAGNLLGPQQSGHITAVGFELYCQLLKQSVSALKGEKVRPRIEVQVRLDFIAFHPGEDTAARAPAKRRKKSAAPDIEIPREVATFIDDDDIAPAEVETRIEVKRALASLPLKYIPEAAQRVAAYRKLAQLTDKPGLEALRAELRDRFGPLPEAVDLLLRVTELKLMASERGISVIEAKDDKLMLTRHNDYIMVGGKFPRLTKKDAKARVNEIRKLLMAL
ncbi:MAG: transcription-repair coupling factor [Verrucomicrobiota bacterium]